MADQTELRMNLAAIKRVDPYARAILDSSAHVAFYTFNATDTEWEKTDVEGAFFIYTRSGSPMYNIFINNRLNTNSLVEPIGSHLELQSQPPFLLYRNERNRIRGFWFYNMAECDRMGVLVERLIRESSAAVAGQPPQPQPLPQLQQQAPQQHPQPQPMLVRPQASLATTATPPPATTKAMTTTQQHAQANGNNIGGQAPAVVGAVQQSVAATPTAEQTKGGTVQVGQTVQQQLNNNILSGPSGVDIFSMLSKAQEDFNNKLVGGSITAGFAAPAAMAPQAAVMPAASQPVAAAPAAAAAVEPVASGGRGDGPSLSVRNFFAAATVPAAATKEAPIFQRMMSLPMSVEQLEKQHQLHQQQQQHQQHQQQQQQHSVAEQHLGVRPSPLQQQMQNQRAVTKPTAEAIATDSSTAVQLLENGVGFMRIASPSQHKGPSSQQQQQQQQLQQPPADVRKNAPPSPLATFISNNSSYLANIADLEQQRKQPLQQLLLRRSEMPPTVAANGCVGGSAVATPAKPALMLPTMFTPTTAAAAPSGGLTTPLQLQATTMAAKASDNNIIGPHHHHHQAQTLINATQPEPLTQSQLLQAMNYLIRNDSDFVRKLHEAYLKSFTEMVSL